MIYIHTYEITSLQGKDYVQFQEWQSECGRYVCESHDIDVVIISMRRNTLYPMMIGVVRNQFEQQGLNVSVRHEMTSVFEDDEYDFG